MKYTCVYREPDKITVILTPRNESALCITFTTFGYTGGFI